MSKQRIVDLGAFPEGSIPAGLSFQYLDGDGNPADMLSGTWAAEGKAEQLHVGSQPVGIGDGVATIDTVTSTGTYAWTSADFGTLGRFQLTLWVGNGTNRYGSPTFEWEVFDAPGDLPTV